MSKGLQWLIGIGVVLVVIAMVFATIAPFVLPRLGLAIGGATPQFGVGREFGFGGPGHMFGGRSMMGGLRMPFFGFGMLIGPLVVIGLIVLAVALFTRRSPAPAATLPAAPAPVAPAPAPAAFAPATTPCAHCGQLLEAGWKACPYCGEKI
jgi:hypothetical protein